MFRQLSTWLFEVGTSVHVDFPFRPLQYLLGSPLASPRSHRRWREYGSQLLRRWRLASRLGVLVRAERGRLNRLVAAVGCIGGFLIFAPLQFRVTGSTESEHVLTTLSGPWPRRDLPGRFDVINGRLRIRVG